MKRSGRTAAVVAPPSLVPSLVLLLALAGGCATISTDRAGALFAAGDYEAAAAALEAELHTAAARGRPGPRCGETELRLALVYSLPADPVQRPERAAELLRSISSRCPDSPWGDIARMLYGERLERDRLRSELAVEQARSAALEERLGRAAGDRATADDERAAGAAGEAARSRELEALRRRVGELETVLAERDQRLRELENELRRLKDIDLDD